MIDVTPDTPGPCEKQAIKFILDSFRKEAITTATDEQSPGSDKPTASRTDDIDDISFTEQTPSDRINPAIVPSDKRYFRMAEASRLVGVEPYVLRYWESEFRIVKPEKTAGNRRIYSRKDVELFLEIRRLIHDEKFSIKGAKQKLAAHMKSTPSQQLPVAPALSRNKDFLKSALSEVKEMIQTIRMNPGSF